MSSSSSSSSLSSEIQEYESPELEPSSLFEQSFRCLPFDKYKNPNLESGNKIIMPQSSLSILIDLPVSYPLCFKIQSLDSGKTSHCGVLEFSADEGFVYMPRWMMKNLDVEEGVVVTLRDAAVLKGSYMKLQPHKVAFVELSDPKEVLETALRLFACVSAGDTIMVRHNEREFYLDVLEVKPGGEAVSLIDTDCSLEFAAALDYVEPPPPRREVLKSEEEEEREGMNEFRPFTGVARRIDGTAVMAKRAAAEDPSAAEAGKKRVKKFGGKLVDEKIMKKDGGESREVSDHEFRPFVGTARRLGGTVEGGGGGGGGAVGEGKKREKEEVKEEFKAFTGRSRVLGGPFFDD